MLIEILIGAITVFGALYFYVTKNYDYWKKRGVYCVPPKFSFGKFLSRGRDIRTVTEKRYRDYKKLGLKYAGGFLIQQPALMVVDLDLCKQILTKDFNHFVTRDFVPSTHEYITRNLFALEGQEWRDMRTKLTPTFTSGKMKSMFLLMEKCAEQLQEHIEDVVLKKGEFLVKDLIARFTTDIIATCAFGLEVNSVKDRENEFFEVAQLIFVPTPFILPKITMIRNFHKISKILQLKLINPRISQFFTKIVKDTVQYRAQNSIVRNDFLDLLVKVKENKSLEDDDETSLNTQKNVGKQEPHHHKDRLTLEEMTAQAFVFFAAGFEAASSTTSFCLYELAMNPEVQEKLRGEIDEAIAKNNGKITYQAIQDMTYMDQVINETLRRYASVPILTRICTKKYQIPGTDVALDEGVRVIIPVYAIHHDPDIYPDPYRFDPDRFSEENCSSRHHYAFLPFGEGPRACIGLRFGKVQIKLGLASILSKYELLPAPDTPSKLEINPLIIFTTAKYPYSLRIRTRSNL